MGLRREILQFVLQTAQQLQIPGIRYFSFVKFLDAAGVWKIIIGLWRHNLASMVALFMSLKLFRVDTRRLVLGELFACRSLLISTVCWIAEIATPARILDDVDNCLSMVLVSHGIIYCPSGQSNIF